MRWVVGGVTPNPSTLCSSVDLTIDGRQSSRGDDEPRVVEITFDEASPGPLSNVHEFHLTGVIWSHHRYESTLRYVCLSLARSNSASADDEDPPSVDPQPDRHDGQSVFAVTAVHACAAVSGSRRDGKTGRASPKRATPIRWAQSPNPSAGFR